MLGQSPVIAFAATANPAEAIAFYQQKLGLTLVEDGPFALVFSAHGTMLRIQKVEQVVPVPYTTLGWHVGDIEATCAMLEQAGVHLERYPHFNQDDHGIMTFPGNAKVAWFKDPDGNLLSLTQAG